MLAITLFWSMLAQYLLAHPGVLVMLSNTQSSFERGSAQKPYFLGLGVWWPGGLRGGLVENGASYNSFSDYASTVFLGSARVFSDAFQYPIFV
jgi:hypothetical protein